MATDQQGALPKNPPLWAVVRRPDQRPRFEGRREPTYALEAQGPPISPVALTDRAAVTGEGERVGNSAGGRWKARRASVSRHTRPLISTTGDES